MAKQQNAKQKKVQPMQFGATKLLEDGASRLMNLIKLGAEALTSGAAPGVGGYNPASDAVRSAAEALSGMSSGNPNVGQMNANMEFVPYQKFTMETRSKNPEKASKKSKPKAKADNNTPDMGSNAADIMSGLMQYLSTAYPQASQVTPMPVPPPTIAAPMLPPGSVRPADRYLDMVSNEHWNKNYAFDALDPMNPRGHAAAANAVQAYYPFAGASMIADALRQPVQAYEAAADQIRQNYPTDQQIYDMYRMGRYYNSAAPYDYMDSPYYTPGELE